MTAQVTAADLLTKARTIIADPTRWTTGTYARNKTGHSVPPSSPNAVCFCTYGAVERAAAELRSDHEVMKDAFRTLQCTAHTHFPPAGPQTPAYINDELGHEAVLKLLDHSIEAARP